MGLAGRVGDEATVTALLIAGKIGGSFAGGQQCAQGGAGSRILYDPASATVRQKFFRQTQHLNQPIKYVGFQFGAGRTCGPQHSLDAKAR